MAECGITMLNRYAPNAAATTAVTPSGIALIDRLVRAKSTADPPSKRLSRYIEHIARLGGYLARASDPPPGNMVMWRGLSRLADIQIGDDLAINDVAN